MRVWVTRRWPAPIVAVVALLLAATASAEVAYSGSTYVVTFRTAEGDRTDAVYLFNSVDFERGRVRGSVTLPVVVQQSRWTDPDRGPVETPWQSGVADPMVRADVAVWRSRWQDTSVRASGAVKVPVASVENGYSSGEVDVGVGMSFSTFRGRNSVLADVTYWMLGDASEVAYRNVPAFYVGYARVLDQGYKWSGIVSISGAPSAIPGFDPPAQVSLAVLRVFGRGAALGLSFDAGLTDGSADFAVGTTWRFVF